LLKGPVITQGYHNNPAANAAGFTEDGWYRTGDVMQFGENSDLLYIVGRTKDIINHNGLKIAPAELEELLYEHPFVADAAVIGVHDQETEVPRAFVALRPGVEASQKNAEDIRGYVKQRVSDQKELRGGVTFVQSVPRLLSGKVWRAKLKEMVASQ
ncbi:acetyl-CoA synthetase-like protein, partial [Aureobasidium melanogenum]